MIGGMKPGQISVRDFLTILTIIICIFGALVAIERACNSAKRDAIRDGRVNSEYRETPGDEVDTLQPDKPVNAP